MEADMTVSMVHRLKDDECEINGNNIREYSYSEHQTGKSCCESKIAHMRTKMKTFVASGKDMITAKDMKVTIDDGSSVVDCQDTGIKRGKDMKSPMAKNSKEQRIYVGDSVPNGVNGESGKVDDCF
ncbi:Hypothetical predicted protein [Mytilus galloprovincialis]|uniref:Uncharacterized protein n=1 Tax=Mytilus galloprovincialis TaxID=29158 RepID=A0A8B6E6M8_MYTGA|nr:Hypothetical predicted protein [Mytilus galloprovincialis]